MVSWPAKGSDETVYIEYLYLQFLSDGMKIKLDNDGHLLLRYGREKWRPNGRTTNSLANSYISWWRKYTVEREQDV